MQSFGKHYKMALSDKAAISDVDCSQATRLGENDLDEVLELYNQAYPGSWFDSRMLNTRQYFGIRMGEKLISVAGIHVYSQKYNVAALGNIATHPHYRRRGLGTSVTARLCQSLSENVEHIGLNVKADNAAAISLYEKLGFEVVTSYHEYAVARYS
jgi:predicted GNAT family acetyltransferase